MQYYKKKSKKREKGEKEKKKQERMQKKKEKEELSKKKAGEKARKVSHQKKQPKCTFEASESSSAFCNLTTVEEIQDTVTPTSEHDAIKAGAIPEPCTRSGI